MWYVLTRCTWKMFVNRCMQLFCYYIFALEARILFWKLNIIKMISDWIWIKFLYKDEKISILNWSIKLLNNGEKSCCIIYLRRLKKISNFTVRLKISHRHESIISFAIRWIMLDNSESGRNISPWEWQLVSPTRASIRTTDRFFSKQKILEEVFRRRRLAKVRDRNILLGF